MSVVISVEIPIQEFDRIRRQTESQIHQANDLTARELGKRAKSLFEGTVSSWEHKPEFTVEVSGSGGNIEVLAGTDDRIYGYLDQGTRVRYAIMSKDWRSKTRPGSLQSGPGGGRVVFISKKRPRPGIQARNFTGRITEILEREAEPTYNRISKRVVRLK